MTAALPSLFALGAWWLGTVVVLRAVWQPPARHAASTFIAAAAAVAGAIAAALLRQDTSPLAAYGGFVAALLMWGVHELTFLLGVVTGPRRAPCPAGARGLERFKLATLAVIHHEIALFLTLIWLVALAWRASNQVAAWTFFVLWSMRLSAKLNVFFGVRSFSSELMPPRLGYLVTYVRRGSSSVLLPLSVGTGAAAAIAVLARVTTADPFTSVASALVGTLLVLAVLEHVFLAVPLGDVVLWRWVARPTPAGVDELGELPVEVR